MQKTPKLLDCFCGLGGVSDGFALEGFDVLGIDIEDMPTKGYKHKFLRADICDLKGKDYRGYDVVWGSPPCRDFSIIGICFSQRWKEKRNPEKGLELVRCFLKFTNDAKPKFWIMENVALLKNYMWLYQPRIIAPLGKSMYRAFWGNFPNFLLPRTNKILIARTIHGKMTHKKGEREMSTWIRAKIPLACSRAFAKAIKEALEIETYT